MRPVLLRLPLFVLLGLSVCSVSAEQIDKADKRAHFNFQMFCQGCHTPDGIGRKSVPTLKGSIGHFLRFQQGREYLVQVPGSANSALDDKQLAEVLNWMVKQFSEDSLPESWQPYQADEVARLRQSPLFETIQYRKQLLKKLATLEP